MTNTRIIWLLFAVTLTLLIALGWQNARLVTPSAPMGIVSLEFSNHVENTKSIRAEWTGDLKPVFYVHIVLDYFLIFFYGLFLYFTSIYFSMLYPETSRMGSTAAFCSLTAAGLDAVENVMMLISITFGANSILSFFTALTSSLKYVLIIWVLTYISINILKTFNSRK